MRRTVKAQLKFEIQAATSGPNAIAFVAMAMDNWYGPTGAAGYQYASYSGGTQGYPIWYTNTSYVSASTPAAGATVATAGLLSQQLPLLDGQVTSTSNVRLVAAGMRVFSDAPVNTAQGKLCIATTSRPGGTAAQGTFISTNYSTISSIPTDVMSFQTEPCAGWKAGHSMYAVAIPSDPNCFQFFNPPATGNADYRNPQIIAILSGGAAGQTFTAQCVYDYEFDVGVSNVTGIDADPNVAVDMSQLTPYVSQMHSGKTGKGNSNKGLGAQAFLTHSALTRPQIIPSVVNAPSSVLATLGGAAQSALGWAANQGVKFLKDTFRGIPLVNGAMKLLGY